MPRSRKVTRNERFSAYNLRVLSIVKLCIRLTIVLTCLLIYGVIFSNPAREAEEEAYPDIGETRLTRHFFNEYFKDKLYYESHLDVDTPYCKIPRPNPRHAYTQRRSVQDCKETRVSWISYNKSGVFINNDVLKFLDYPISSLRCCSRDADLIDLPSRTDDNIVGLSKHCSQMNHKTNSNLTTGFAVVFCNSTLQEFISLDFVAVPKFDEKALNKTMMWSTPEKFRKGKVKAFPPNVVILGVDSHSRINSFRNLEKTRNLLKQVGAVELLGYTKVENQDSENIMAFLSGYSKAELTESCLTNSTLLDNCSFIWNAFDKVGYLTVSGEDYPEAYRFDQSNYRMSFSNKPTDFYMFPFWEAVHRLLKEPVDCIGRQMPEEVLLDYILEVMQDAKNRGIPLFAHGWLSRAAHDNYGDSVYLDNLLSRYIQIFTENKNTILFFMSNTGQRTGSVRETLQGWYEDRLPMQWVYIPPTLRQEFPEWYTSLQTNAQRLTSHFDLYKTLLHILFTFDTSKIAMDFYSQSLSQKGASLFKEIPPERTCESAGIPWEFCACIRPHPLDVDNALVAGAVRTAECYLQKMVPNDCYDLSVDEVVTAASMSTPKWEGLIVSFATKPEHFKFRFEAYIDKYSDVTFGVKKLFRVSEVDMKRSLKCAKSDLAASVCAC